MNFGEHNSVHNSPQELKSRYVNTRNMLASEKWHVCNSPLILTLLFTTVTIRCKRQGCLAMSWGFRGAQNVDPLGAHGSWNKGLGSPLQLLQLSHFPSGVLYNCHHFPFPHGHLCVRQ